MIAEMQESISVCGLIMLVCIAAPANTGSIPHDNIVDGLLWNLPLNHSRLYANKKNPSAIPIGNNSGESKNA